MFYSLTVPTPIVVLTVLDGSTHYAGINLSITCMITTSVNVDSAVTIDINWFNGTRRISNDTGRVSISSLSGKRPPYNSTLVIGPLSDLDNSFNFTCKASAFSDSVFIGQSGVGESSVNILIQHS